MQFIHVVQVIQLRLECAGKVAINTFPVPSAYVLPEQKLKGTS